MRTVYCTEHIETESRLIFTLVPHENISIATMDLELALPTPGRNKTFRHCSVHDVLVTQNMPRVYSMFTLLAV